jgi:hypothetical protein
MNKIYFLPLLAGIAFGKLNWKPLFNGKTFEPEWYIAGDKNYWKIQDSAIVGFSTSGTPYTMVFTNKSDFKEFTVKYQYRLKAGCSGFFFRSQNIGSELVEGVQVEAKNEGGTLKKFGSLYSHPTPGWVKETAPAFWTKARPIGDYQDVVLTVKDPFVYVNMNGSQALGDVTPAEKTAGANDPWNFSSNQYIAKPGRIGLQIHGGQAQMDVAFKNIFILEGCGDATKPGYDGAFVPGLPKQPAFYQDNGTCTSSGIEETGPSALRSHVGRVNRAGKELTMKISYPGAHTLEIISLNGKVVFSGSAPATFVYHISGIREPGIYVAKFTAGKSMVSQRILIP